MTDKISFESALHIAVQQYKCDQLESIPSLEQLALEFTASQNLLDIIENVIQSAEKADKVNNTFKTLKKVAVILLISFTLMLTSPTFVTAMKKIVSNTVIEWYDGYISMVSKADSYPLEMQDVKVGYITEGFVLREVNIFPNDFNFSYSAEHGYISVYVYADNGNTTSYIDNDRTTFGDIEIDGNKGMARYCVDGANGVIISVDGIVYDVFGYVEMEEIIKIYRSIEVKI